MRDLVADARELARGLLDSPALARRWAHVQAVAARAGELAAAVAPGEREMLVAAAWLHDIGYGTDLVATGFHPLDGARYLERAGWPNRLVALVAHHSGARFEAAERGLLAELDGYPMEGGPLVDALVAADLTTGPAGQRLTFVERIEEILSRYPADSPVHRAVGRARPILAAHLDRVAERLSARGSS